MKLITIFLLIGSALSGIGQSILELKFSNQLTNSMDPPLKGLLFTYKYLSDTIYFKGVGYKIKPPKSADKSNSSFGFISFHNHGSSGIPSQVLFFVDKCNTEFSRIYLDKNYDLDFNNEESLDFANGVTVLAKLVSQNNTSRIVESELRPIVFRNLEHEKRLESMANKEVDTSIRNELLAAKFWMMITTLDYKSAVQYPDIGLQDWNGNGLFNDPLDLIITSDSIGKKVNTRSQVVRYEIGKDSVIEFRGKKFSVVKVDSLGNSMLLQELLDGDFLIDKIILKSGKNLPDFGLYNLKKGEQTTWSKLKPIGKFILLDFWGTWCKPCIETIPTLKNIRNQFSDRLEIVSLDYGDDLKKATEFIASKQMNWIHGSIDKQLVEKFVINKFPYYILLDKEGTIVETDIKLDDLSKLIH